MNLLLDTHVFLWYITGDKRLSVSLSEAIRSSENTVYLSVVSLWEVIIKFQLGKLPLPFDRILICQALTYNLTIATVDDQIRAYDVPAMQ